MQMLSVGWAFGLSAAGRGCAVHSRSPRVTLQKGSHPPRLAPALPLPSAEANPTRKVSGKLCFVMPLGHDVARLTLTSFFFCRERDQRAGLRSDDADRLRGDGHQDSPHQKLVRPSLPPRAAQESHQHLLQLVPLRLRDAPRPQGNRQVPAVTPARPLHPA